jgi:hypothetical protein
MMSPASPSPLPFASDRQFSVVSYARGHGLLLLRSERTDEYSTRIELLITDVRAMEIRSWFTGIEITETDEQYLASFQSKPVEMVEVGNRIYSLNGNGGPQAASSLIIPTQTDCRSL